MYKEIEMRLRPNEAGENELLYRIVAQKVGVSIDRIKHIEMKRRAIDARKRDVVFNLLLGVHIDEIIQHQLDFQHNYNDVSSGKPVVVIGAGPAGLFAALRLIERGFRPIILERGKCVEDRKKDLAHLYKTGEVNPNSNFGYGEGGAGTFSDGKLYTRSKKRGNVRRILEILVHHGASESILVDAHPHIGTDKLPKVIVNIRKTIEKCGGEFYFDHLVDQLIIRNNQVVGVVANGKEWLANNVILATGHSARDVYQMLASQGVFMERKEFAVGMRLEHSQHDIDCMQYHNREGRGQYLPAAEYNFVTNVDGRGVYSFCMCPGGVVVPAATGPDQQVVNGMSASKRNTAFSNAAFVTSIGDMELEQMGYSGLFAGIEFQRDIEKLAFIHGREALHAPAQRLKDFIKGKESKDLPKTSYHPGITSTNFAEWYPEILYKRMVSGFIQIGKKAPMFIERPALLLGLETRTSSPLRIPRDRERFMHVEIQGLFPAGEGAGYAGGIVSAAMDGDNCANGVI